MAEPVAQAAPGKVTKKHLPLLCKKLREENAEWEQFGTSLYVPYPTIQAIKENPDGKDVVKKMEAVLNKWRRESNNKTWREIYNAVVDLQDFELAERIKQSYPNLDSEAPVCEDDYMSTMMTLLRGVIPQWESFGLALDLDYDELQVINAGKLTAEECMKKLLVTWISLKAEKATIYEIITACHRVKNVDLAERLENDDEIKTQFKIDGVCKVFYEETPKSCKAHVVIAKADKEKELIAKYKGFHKGQEMIIGFIGAADELSLDYSVGYISGWKVENHKPQQIYKSQIDKGQLCAFTIVMVCEAPSTLKLEIKINGIHPPNTLTIDRNSYVYSTSTPMSIPSKRPHTND